MKQSLIVLEGMGSKIPIKLPAVKIREPGFWQPGRNLLYERNPSTNKALESLFTNPQNEKNKKTGNAGW